LQRITLYRIALKFCCFIEKNLKSYLQQHNNEETYSTGIRSLSDSCWL